jgi:molybdopterin synthase catalytic subunit
MIDIVNGPIDTQAMLARAAAPSAGAVVLFLGTTREWTDAEHTAWLEYECYADMARRELAKLETEARKRWPLVACEIVHRIGRVEISQASVAIVVSTPHRQAAFEAGQWIIDTLKKTVPIWKKEHGVEGQGRWVHPGLELATEKSSSEIRNSQ